MAKSGKIQNNLKRRKLVDQHAEKRARLKAVAKDTTVSSEERFKARLQLAEMPRNGAKDRIRNRCEITGRPRGYYRKLRMCRNKLRELASLGQIPGMTKSSW
ncbi:MAG: 30S ribosomal protein S14 [Pseudomonadota bacterium]